MNQFLAIVAGGGISGVVGVVVAFVQQHLSRRTLNQSVRRQLMSELVSASSAGNMRISDLARAPMAEKDEVRGRDAYRSAVDNFNTAVVQIELTEESSLVREAVKIDRVMTELAQKAVTAQFTRDEWTVERKPAHQAIREFLRVARQELGSPQLSEKDGNSMFRL